jgi:hypothetical protein
MVKDELISRSPVRVFMKSIHGGLQPGEVGLIAAPSGIGKTSVLVQIALDKLLQGKKVIHVSFSQLADNVTAWYEDIFNEFIKRKNLENEADVKDEIVRNRVTMMFNQEVFTVDMINSSLRAMITQGGFKAEYVMVDGFDFTVNGPQGASPKERLAKVKAFAEEMGLSVWYSCSTGKTNDLSGALDKRRVPLVVKDYADLFAAIIVLEPKQDHIALTVSKDLEVYNPEQMALRLDPKTLLIQNN